MEVNNDLIKELIPNNEEFKGEFFERFKLRHNQNPLNLSEDVTKNYLFPTLYGDVTCAMGIFFCNYAKAQAMMPQKSLKPVKGTLGRALVIFSCYEYKKVLNIGPYNEIAMTIPVMLDASWSPPLLPMVMKSFKKMGYYVFSMPVTSKENKIRGQKIWGLPKKTEDIQITIANNECTTTALDDNGNEYFQLTVPTSGKIMPFDETGHLYSVHRESLLKSQTNFKGDFKINKNMSLVFKKNLPSDREWLKLGESPSASVLKDLDIEPSPFQFRFCASMESCFDLPERL